VFETVLLGGGGSGGAQLIEPPVDLGPDQCRVGQQVGDVPPDEAVEVVNAHRLVVAGPAVLVAVVVPSPDTGSSRSCCRPWWVVSPR
jgi:hypothetical protein